MIVSAVSCPHPPLLMPGVTGGTVAEVEELRAACLRAIAALLEARLDLIVMVGGVRVHEGDEPLSLTVGRSLLAEAGCGVRVDPIGIRMDSSVGQCLKIGRMVSKRTGRIGLLVMADGSARRGLKAPGYLDRRAFLFDGRVEDALGGPHPSRLADLEPNLASDLLVAGRAAWQVLAGAFGGRTARAVKLYSDDPFGVWYPVFLWDPEPSDPGH